MSAFSFSNDGVLTFRSSPDYENPADMGMDNMYMVTITADDGTYMDTHDVMVMVTNVDEAGTLTLSTMRPAVGEEITATLTDIDIVVGSSVTWQWARSMDMNSWMDITTGGTNRTYTPTMDDDGMYLRVTAMYTDGEGSGKTEMAMTDSMVIMASTNTAPMFPDTEDGARMVAENTAAGEPVGDPVTAMDTDAGDTLTYALSGADMASFTIDGSMGQITVGATTMLDYETRTTYMVTVTATDAGGEMDMVAVTVTVTNVDEDGTVTLSSMQPVVDTMLTATLDDLDGDITGTTWQWASSATSDGTFAPITGATLASYTPVEADVGMYLQATASYTDGEGAGKTAMAVLANMVSMASTAPMFDTETAERMVEENTAAEENVGGPVAAMDADDDTLTYALSGTDAASFDIDNMGQIKVSMGTMLDYETRTTYMVTVTATDGAGATDTIDVTITVTDEMLGEPADTYDADNNEIISRSEVLDAIDDYFDSRGADITKVEVLSILRIYMRP